MKTRRFKFADCKGCKHSVRVSAACLTCTIGENFEEKEREELTDIELFALGEEMDDDD